MDPEELRSLLRDSGVDLWTFMEGAISVAARDHGDELRERRDGIVERLYAPAAQGRCRNCEPIENGGGRRGCKSNGREEEKGSSSPAAKGGAGAGYVSPATPQSMKKKDDDDDDEDDRRGIGGGSVEDQKSKILAIKEFLDEEDQSEESVAGLLQNLVDMDVTFKALKETDIGRHVNGLRKHPSTEVRRLVKILVRKWKEIVDEWVKTNSNVSPAIIGDSDSPMQINGRNNENGNSVPDFGYSPNPHNGALENVVSKAKVEDRRDVRSHSTTAASSATPAVNQPKDSMMDPERLASARRRLQENYQEAQNAKKQRTIQMMDIHEIPKPKNAFVQRNKGGSSHQGRHW